jgi:ABC-type dipeptide/oligopeptide/nickel transport system permease subunit
MTDNKAKPISITSREGISERRTTPLGDAWKQFRRNKIAVLGLVVIILITLLAVTASLWTEAGILDSSRGYRAQHTLNPVGWKSIDSYADPGDCARDNLDQGEPWCALLDAETRKRFDGYCPEELPDLNQRQWCFVLGSDGQGKDIMTQTVYGARISMAVALIGSLTSFLAGIVYGVVAGYYGGRLDNLMMRFVDFLYGVPGLVIIILMQVFFREISNEYADKGGLVGFVIGLNKSTGGLLFLFIALGLLSWIGMARLARGQVLSYRQKEFVEAARAVGASDRRIIFVHLLPNIIGPLLVSETLAIPGYIFAEAFLSFIGLGVQPGVPSWGQMISAFGANGGLYSNRHLVLVPSVALVVLTLAFNFFGDGLRDALDPRMRGK